MGRRKEPVELVVAKGNWHISKKEIKERREKEVKVPFKDAVAPDYLTEKQKEKFNDLAYKLEVCKIYTELDVDVLARYVVAHDMYLYYTSKLTKAFRKRDLDWQEIDRMQRYQDKAFNQATICARELGLTISSRCRIEVPVQEQEPKKNKFNKFEVV